MSLIRNGLAAIAGAMLFLPMAACHVDQRKPPAEPLNVSLVQTDPAMAERSWNPSVATYKNDGVMAWPTYSPLKSNALPVHEAVVTDPILFIADVAYIPVGMVIDRPFNMVEYKSLSTPPTYNAMPPLKPATQPSDFDIRQK